jgi:hypothetical protein
VFANHITVMFVLDVRHFDVDNVVI